MKTNTNKRLDQFKQIKKPLLKEWGEGFRWDALTKSIYFTLKHNIDGFMVYEAGTKREDNQSESNMTDEQLENLFGLPYTSSGDFAGIWNTNTQARAKYGAPLYFRGVAVADDLAAVLIFDQPQKNAVEKTYYFYDYEFNNYQREERARERAQKWGEFVKDANKVASAVFEIVKSYNGKQYGEKTKRKIYEEINKEAERVGACCWLETAKHWQGVEISRNRFRQFYHFSILNEQNTIETTEKPQQIEEIDGAKQFDTAKEIWQKMKKHAEKLRPLIEEYNKTIYKINIETKATQSVYGVDLEKIETRNSFWEV